MLSLNVNGKPVEVDADPEMPLLWVLRDVLRLTGTKYGCGMALCGACTVHLDGEPTRACVTPVSVAAGKSVTTIEGLSPNGEHPVQRAWMELDVVQCESTAHAEQTGRKREELLGYDDGRGAHGYQLGMERTADQTEQGKGTNQGL